MFCENCGAKTTPDERYCENCGHPLGSEPTPSTNRTLPPIPLPRMGRVAPDPITGARPQPQTPIPASANALDGPSTTAKPRHVRLIPILAAVVALVLVITGGGLAFTHHAGMWGHRTLPAAAELQSESGKKLTANIVADQLHSQGIKTKVNKVYSGKRSGEFAGYQNAKAGDKIAAGQTVTVNESMGPGVPKGTVGRKAADVAAELRAMNVPVTFRQMPVDDIKRYPAGTVVTTFPADGSPVADTKTGINVAVASDGQADVPYDIIGLDKNTAKKSLESAGYLVTLKPKFSSKRYLGKIVDSDPKPGVYRPMGRRTTLYYGADASQGINVVGEHIDYDDGDDGTAITNVRGLAGTYCTDGSDCVTLTPDGTSGWESTLVTDEQLKSGEWKIPDDPDGVMHFENGLSLCTYVQAETSCIPRSRESRGYLDDFLINGDTGAMELYSGNGLPNCGTQIFPFDSPVYCTNGQIVSGPANIDNYNSKDATKELVYKPKEFFVVMPVGANLAKLKASGYFAGASDYRPDANRPYLIRRDNSAYQTVKAYADDGMTLKPDPYAPGSGRTAFKQAPNTKNVYYLVEDGGVLDWDALQPLTVTPNRTDGTTDTKAVFNQAFTTLAGKYTYRPGADGKFTESMTVKSDGSFTGQARTLNNGKYRDTSKPEEIATSFKGRFTSATENSDGTYTLQCDAKSFTADGDGDRKSIGFETCGKFVAYPKGTFVDVALGGNKAGEKIDTPEAYKYLNNRSTFENWTIVNKGTGKSDFGVYERASE
ncbi:zinc-ribbon domain-containing protein [Bifidobacterium sp. 82T24]|uniref:zinc-ribbon domain-containing protein n=1 Tax=Bifidobacterium pluvialisilvae TaxID=2834436 RepID=UPI001C57E82C|nr:zinc-ribbon domain-containing protein [Bifidobacterium pluvialisilvae]MBW3087274.1 zinc-ribbon domain-containing protein [Bifidobacterium pluvialisilvae]